MGFSWNERYQPIIKEKLTDMGIGRNRFKDILDNRTECEPMNQVESTVLAYWLGIDPSQLYDDSDIKIEDLVITIKLKAA